MADSPQEPRDVSPPRAIRATLTYEGSELVTHALQMVNMRVPPSDRPPRVKVAGTWVELRDRENRVLYRRTLAVPLGSIEAPSGDPERGLMWLDAPEARRTLVLLVPDLEPAATLTVVESIDGTPKDLWTIATKPPRGSKGRR